MTEDERLTVPQVAELAGIKPSTFRAYRTRKRGRKYAPEPDGWQRTATDATASRQGPGGVGLWAYLSGSSTAPVVLRVDDLAAGTVVVRR